MYIRAAIDTRLVMSASAKLDYGGNETTTIKFHPDCGVVLVPNWQDAEINHHDPKSEAYNAIGHCNVHFMNGGTSCGQPYEARRRGDSAKQIKHFAALLERAARKRRSISSMIKPKILLPVHRIVAVPIDGSWHVVSPTNQYAAFRLKGDGDLIDRRRDKVRASLSLAYLRAVGPESQRAA